MVLTACLLAVLAIYVGLWVIQRVVRALRLDVWDWLVYFGLAEDQAPPAPPPARARRSSAATKASLAAV